MTMNRQDQSHSGCAQRRFAGVSPSEAADAELTWFFNEAQSAVDTPSNFSGLFSGTSATSMEEVERRAEAMHAARKVYDRLTRLRERDALLLCGLYTERPWPDAVVRALPHGLAGAAANAVCVRVEFVRALAEGRTRATRIVEFIEEAAERRRWEVLARWRAELEPACAAALSAYERVRGSGPSVVPQEDA